MKSMLRLSPILFLLASELALASCEGPDDVVAACLESEVAEVKLNEAYRILIGKLNQPSPELREHHSRAKKSIVLAQRAWLKFRDLDCSAAFDLADGTSKAALSMSCIVERNLQRASELRAMANGL